MSHFDPSKRQRRDPDPVLGPHVQHRRRSLGWTQRRLADEIGVGVRWLQDIEQGRRRPSFVVLRKLGRALGEDYAVIEDEPPKPAPVVARPPAPVVASLPLPRQPGLGPSPTTLSPGAVVQGHTISYWLANDRSARAAAEPPPRRPSGPPFASR